MIVVAARPAVGKALALDTPLPTPTGWTTMGEVQVGDRLIDAHGKPTRVVAATEVMVERPCFEVEFSDGTVIVADAEHQWAIAGGEIVTTVYLSDLGLRPKILHDHRYVHDIRRIASVPVRCVEVDNEEHLYLASRSMIPTHNSTLGIDIARSASIKHGLATAVFSLEMSRTEITMRILSAEAQIQLQDLRKGTLGDVGWQKLARLSGEISEAPLFIDDSPNMSLTEIRAKCRRLKQLHNLRLVVIDYLQLMSSGKKVESRQQEVSEFSRALKLLAKELEVPVIAISQLNRGPEQRTDKRPQMSDLRESGCVPADTRILRADTGAETTIGELAASGERDVTVWSLDDGLRYTKRTMTHAFSTGVAPVFRLTLASGKTVRATENHPLLTASGWRPLGSLRAGDKVGVPRHVPSPARLTTWSDAEVFAAAVDFPSRDVEHRVAEPVFSLPKEQIAAYLRHVWEFAGAVDSCGEGGRIYAWHDSRLALEGIARLLLRFGIETSHEIHPCGGDHVLDISGVDSMRRFLQEIGAPDKCREQGEDLLGWTREVAVTNAFDAALRGDLEATLNAHGESGFGGSLALLERVEATLDRGELDLAATNDVVWERIEMIRLDGVEEVFDATVLDCHNFIADGIAVHNSIEQDADVVILLHRDKSEPEREGEADVIVAKHRNGPTKDIVLAFQGHYSRFANMAKDF
jgi:replicative DNA helicase